MKTKVVTTVQRRITLKKELVYDAIIWGVAKIADPIVIPINNEIPSIIPSDFFNSVKRLLNIQCLIGNLLIHNIASNTRQWNEIIPRPITDVL